MSSAFYIDLKPRKKDKKMIIPDHHFNYQIIYEDDLNVFLIIDKQDNRRFATGRTIKEALKELEKRGFSCYPNTKKT